MKKALISLGGAVISAILYYRAHEAITIDDEIRRLHEMKLEYEMLLSEARELKKIGQHAASSAVTATADSKLVAMQLAYKTILYRYNYATLGWIERRRFEKNPKWEFIRESLKD